MIRGRDPVAELWAGRSRGRRSRALAVPVKRLDGSLVWLSPGQFALLVYVRGRMRHGRGRLTLAQAGDALDAYPGSLSRRLDRLAQLGLVGRRSRVGRGNGTTVWPPRIGPRWWSPVANVATSTATRSLYVRSWLSRDYYQRSGGSPPAGAAPPRGALPPPVAGQRPRRRPPRVLYQPCPRGHRVRLARWRFLIRDRQLQGVYDGWCEPCGIALVAPVTVELPRDGLAPIPAAVRFTGARPAPSADQATPARSALAARFLADGELTPALMADIGAAYLGWRPPRDSQPAPLVAGAGELDDARRSAWSLADPRYSQPRPPAEGPPSSVRYSQPGAGPDDGHARPTDAGDR